MSERAHEALPEQRAIIDRRAIADRLAYLRPGKKSAVEAAQILSEALAEGRAEIVRRLSAEPGNGRAAAPATTFLHDQIVRLSWDLVCGRGAGSLGQGLSLVGLGGTGRGEMAPFSDLDLMCLSAKTPSADQ